MEARRYDRINRLSQALKRTDKLHLKDAAELLNVSEMTVRRDLAAQNSDVVLLGATSCSIPRSIRAFAILSAISRSDGSKRSATSAPWPPSRYRRMTWCF